MSLWSPSRRDVLGLAGAGAAALAGCSDRPLGSSGGSGAFPDADWPPVAGDPHNSGDATDWTAPGGVERAWTNRIDGWPWTSPVIGDGTVYVADERRLLAVDAATGDRDWTARLGSEREPGGAPAYHDGTVYVPTRDPTTEADAGAVRAVDADGDELWTRTVDEEAVYAATVADGTVYARTAGGVVALADGEQAWRHGGLDPLEYPEYNMGDSVDLVGNAAPAVAGGTVFVPDRGGVLALDRATGERRWRADVAHAMGVSVGADAVYVQGYTELRAFGRDGTPRWRREEVGGTSAPTLGDGAAYAKYGDALLELDPASGETMWSFDLRTGVLSSPSPVLSNAVLAPSHRSVAVRRSGPLVGNRGWWATEFDPAQFSAPAVGAGLLVLVDPFRERVVAFEGA